jgi:transcriptional regulator with XRE-family HTH domain
MVEKHLGIEELCRRLGTTASTLQAWRLGHEEMPDAQFLKLVDLLLEIDPDGMFPPRKS